MPFGSQLIRDCLEHGLIVIDPLYEPIQPTSVDLRLGPVLLDERGEIRWDLRAKPYQLKPGEFILASTLERVVLPGVTVRQIVGILCGKSTLARAGVQVEAAGYVDPGWDGNLTLEILNMTTNVVITLELGMRIAQIRFEDVTGKLELPYGYGSLGSHYQYATGPQSGVLRDVYARPARSDLPDSDCTS